MRILVTGAGGFIGGMLARRLAEDAGMEVLACGRTLPGGAAGAALDLLDRSAVEPVLANFTPDVVVHAAGRVSGDPQAMLRDNALATARLGEAMAACAPAARLLLIGSAAQYGPNPGRRPWREDDLCDPRDPYGISKQVAETAVMRCGWRAGPAVTTLRLFNLAAGEPVGPQVFPSFLRKAAAAVSGPAPRRASMGPLDAVRDFVDIDDVWRAVAAVIERGVWGEVINVATGHGRTARELIEATLTEADRDIALDAAPYDGGGVDWSVGDPAKCERLLGFAPSADLTRVIARAASFIASADQTVGADARSRA